MVQGSEMDHAELKAARAELKLSTYKFSDALGISRTSLWNYERGAMPVPKTVALAVSALKSQADK